MNDLTPILSLLGQKWALPVLATLRGDPKRFTQILPSIPGVSHRMLAMTLKQLEAGGLIKRTAPPKRVSYSLTERGRTLPFALETLRGWLAENPAGS